MSSPAHDVPAETAPASPGPGRLAAIDRMRGLVMILMVMDHADSFFDRNHQMHDSASIYAGQAFPAAEYLVRWLTHLCAPTFVFLAGVAIALSIHKRTAMGAHARDLDRHLIKRGLFIAALDPLIMSVSFLTVVPGMALFQVLYAIGLSLALMAGLRRLPSWALLLGAAAILTANEWIVPAHHQVFGPDGQTPPMWLAATLVAGFYSPAATGLPVGAMILYPLLPWLAIMMLGWVFGRWLTQASRASVARWLALMGAALLVGFLVVRGLNGWGNAALLRSDDSVLQWLHVSKYPPSVSFVMLELGLMALLLAGFTWLEQRGLPRPRPGAPLLVFGRTALFFYLLHVPLLQLMSWGTWLVTGADRAALPPAHGLGSAFLAMAAALVLLYPLCVRYGRYKQAHPDGWTRYL
ncbi:DUF1624 domain-containing protein [Haliangium sp.]|uniref:DUF1624 domain-containing protein n=1 Tax=Haliangium sp. TaxID=2663208 RepID=UPI003D12B07C